MSTDHCPFYGEANESLSLVSTNPCPCVAVAACCCCRLEICKSVSQMDVDVLDAIAMTHWAPAAPYCFAELFLAEIRREITQSNSPTLLQ